MRHTFLATSILLSLAVTGSAHAQKSTAAVSAQDYPTKPVRLVVPYPPGGGNDTLARMFGVKLTEAWGQQIVVDNRGGAGTTIGTSLAARAVPDGYTILLSSIATHAISPNLYSNPGYDPIKDFAPITLLAIAPTVLCVNPAVPANSVKELIALAKAKPGDLKFASGGNGTPPHMAGVIFASMTGIKLLHVPYKGGGPAIAGLIGGETTMMFDTAASILPHVRSGRLKSLAIARSARLPEYPNLQTFAEAGVPGYEVNAWYSMHAPAGTPAPIIAKWNRELVRILKLPDIQQRLKQLGSEGVGNAPEAFAKFVRAESAKYAKAIKESGTKVD
ncbi:MAG: Tricarboxylate transport protein TctC [Burkholderiales bacterium]|jgi:tripartite-type tricarboxylate transporter receptor subunit TctC|nr:Tricarboxylate transport protein TctC [Burkholderiales bacterium]